MNDCRSDVSPVNIIISDDSHPYSEEAENNYSELEIASTGIRDKSSSIGAYSIRGENEQCHQRARYMTDISTEHDNETIRETGRVVKFIAERSRILFISVIIILLIVVIILTVVLCTKDKETHYKDKVQKAVNGSWGNWSFFSQCSFSCGGGTHYRFRRCDNPLPANGGSWCLGDELDVQACNKDPCPVAGGWGSWISSSPCSYSCGGGIQPYQRSCDTPYPANGGAHCRGNATEMRPCNTNTCPVNGGWGSWSTVSACACSSGGGGFIYRIRRCESPRPANGGTWCYGNDIDVQLCSTNPSTGSTHSANLTVLNSKMNKAMENYTIELASESLKNITDRQETATYVHTKLEERYGGDWSCFIGQPYSFYVRHEDQKFIFFKMGKDFITVFKAP